MRILILEDSEERIKQMNRVLVGHEVVVMTTARDCIVALSNETFDVLSLDHDLGGQEMVESGPGTGYEVAYWLGQHPDRCPPRVVLHTFNPVGRMNMAAVLPCEPEVLPSWWKPVGL